MIFGFGFGNVWQDRYLARRPGTNLGRTNLANLGHPPISISVATSGKSKGSMMS
jgi:hypothetical protein